MICIIALVVFGILGIFSASQRKIAKEAFDCVFRRLTLRKCETGLDKRLKAQITGKVMVRWPKTGGFLYKYFEWFSWALVILMVVSRVYTAYGGYNYVRFGNCNGPDKDQFCIFDPLGSNNKISAPSTCSANINGPKTLTLNNTNLSLFPTYNKGAKNQLIFIGCYGCTYTREVYPEIKKVYQRPDVEFIFMHFPVKQGSEYLSNYAECIYKENKTKLLEFNDKVFSEPIDNVGDEQHTLDIVRSIGMDPAQVKNCTQSQEIKDLITKQFDETKDTGVYGTPTVFINGQHIVGPKPYRVYWFELH